MGYIILFLLNLIFPFAAVGIILAFLFSSRRNLLKNLKNEVGQRFVLSKNKNILGGYIWIHAASVGEVKSAVKIAQDLKDFYKRPVLITTSTAAGRAAAEKELAFDASVLMPADFYFFVKRFIKIYSPFRLFIMESDLWPNMIIACGNNKIPVAVINGRLSQRSAARYKILSPLVKLVFKNISFICAQSEDIRSRYIGLGAVPAKVHTTGNMKYDMLNAEPPRLEEAQTLIDELGWRGSKIITLGSTHLEEERVAISAAKTFADIKFIIAPRHLERIKYILSMLKESGLKYAVLSEIEKNGIFAGGSAQILLIDAMGWLGAFYKISDMVFVGGSISKKGGHNFLEAAILRKPVIFGKYYYNAPDVAKELIKSGGGILAGGDNFADIIKKFIYRADLLKAASAASANTALSFKGATAKTMAAVKKYEKKFKA
jgi:3-deoxy-D-manno-octulosonic-acid transferase